ncbi:Cof-type HAD-IIB family hydrolase [Streptococcus sp. DD13]|uniref:Cof-type HAD-IIB family hydrolase n=1 Tax=Streptococcus sp. DD13 TaxID=1777881 RepID=UPI00079175CE|nr:Cof-type HAD-IIB family hydrolase [Streptococcus sp. DD13]KXT78656.1 Hydrolase (HAD superfamily) [Streptococcus sp. DD13]
MLKLLALDMDGTLLNSAKEISPANRKTIQELVKTGVKLVLCTGRPIMGVKPYFEELGLKEDQEYIILNNGCTTVLTKDWSVVNSRTLSNEDVQFLYQVSVESETSLTIFDDSHYIILGQEPNELVTYDAGLVFETPFQQSLEDCLQNVRNYQVMFVAEKEKLDRFQKQYETSLSKRFTTVRSQDYLFEALPLGTTKATALEALAQQLGILPSEIMAIGDANNDIEMLSYAGLGIAMGNAPEHIQALADDVTDTNDRDGVAKAINHYILTKNKTEMRSL